MPKSSSRYIEMELNISKDSIDRTLTEQKWHSDYKPFPAFTCFGSVRFLIYLFRKLHLAMKEKRYADIEDILRSTTAILNIVSTDEIKMSCNFIIFIIINQLCQNIFSFLDFYLVLELLPQTLYALEFFTKINLEFQSEKIFFTFLFDSLLITFLIYRLR